MVNEELLSCLERPSETFLVRSLFITWILLAVPGRVMSLKQKTNKNRKIHDTAKFQKAVYSLEVDLSCQVCVNGLNSFQPHFITEFNYCPNFQCLCVLEKKCCNCQILILFVTLCVSGKSDFHGEKFSEQTSKINTVFTKIIGKIQKSSSKMFWKIPKLQAGEK